MVTGEFKGLVKGAYGRTPAPIDPDFVKKIIGDETPITARPADALSPELPTLKKACEEYSIQPEDVLSYALFEKVAVKFFEQRKKDLAEKEADANALFVAKVEEE